MTVTIWRWVQRGALATKRFRAKAIDAGNPMPRVMNVDKNPASPAAVETVEASHVVSPCAHVK